MFISLITIIPTIRYDKDLATMVRVIREFLKIPETVFTTQVFLASFPDMLTFPNFAGNPGHLRGAQCQCPRTACHPHTHTGENHPVVTIGKWWNEKLKYCSENCCCLFPALFFHHWRFRLCTQTSLFSSTRASTMQANISTEISGAVRIILWTSDNL